MASVNKVILVGHLGRDPEIRSMQSGDKVANFSIATSETWKDKASGEKKERTTWHNIVVWNQNIVKVVESYVKKGDKIYIEGSIETREYEKDGVKKYATEVVLRPFRGEIVLLGGKKHSDDQHDPQTGEYVTEKEKVTKPVDELSDEIPF